MACTAIVSVVIIDSGLLYAVVVLASVDVLCVCMRESNTGNCLREQFFFLVIVRPR